MRARTLPMAAVLFLLILAVPRPVLSQNEVSITGVIMDIENRHDMFRLQELVPGGQGRIWMVRVTVATEARRPQDLFARGAQPTLRLLRVGDVVELHGWIVGSNELMARAITVRAERVGNSRDSEGAGQEIRITGTIVDLDPRGQGTLQLQPQSFVRGVHIWTVRLYPHTTVDGHIHDRIWDAGNDRGPRAALHLLRVGDFIEVGGRVLRNRQILAKEITVRAHSGVSPAPAPFPGPFHRQTVIFTPHEGAEVSGGEFPVIGQTMPGAQVRLEVSARFGVFTLPVASGAVMADQSGFFMFAVRPPFRIPGATYTITVTSVLQGFSVPPVSVTVRQL